MALGLTLRALGDLLSADGRPEEDRPSWQKARTILVEAGSPYAEVSEFRLARKRCAHADLQ